MSNARTSVKAAVAMIALAPSIAFAQLGNSPFEQTLQTAKNILNFFLGAAVPLATAFFFWNLIQFIRNAEDEAARKKAKSGMLWGAVALFMMAGVWTVIYYVTSSIGLQGGANSFTQTPNISIPQAP
jgi:hypothetical protein